MAAARPEVDVLAFEVYLPGVARTVNRLHETDVANVRLLQSDAVDGLTHLLGPGSVQEVWTFFPDPWPKVRHHKRRLVDRAFADLVASRLRPGGAWRLATDWADYAAQMRVGARYPTRSGERGYGRRRLGGALRRPTADPVRAARDRCGPHRP